MSTNAKAHPKQSQHELISLARGTRPERIIHLDDEPFVRDATKLMLDFYFKDYVTVECSTGDDAWNEISRQNPDLLITDYSHCGMRIEEMLSLLSRQSAKFPILIMSAFLGGCPDAKERLLSQADFSITLLNKPFLAEELKVEVLKCFDSATPNPAGVSEQDRLPGTGTEITKPGTSHSHRDCKPLLKAATKDLFRNNAFRVIGLSVCATTREVATHANKLAQLAELGQDPHTQNAAFSMKPPPSLDEIREAIQRLKDPEKRLIDEFFWFWPCEFGRTTPDPALQALASGDAEAALEIWAANETNPSNGVIAMHNIALFWQLTAFDLETHNASRAEAGGGRGDGPGRYEADCVQEQTVEKYWRDSLKRWKYLAFDDVLWDKVAARVRQTDDPHLTSGFVRRMRDTLPLALAKINAELALAHAQKGRTPLARMHVQLVREGSDEPATLEKAAELVLAPTKARLKEQIKGAQERAKKNRQDAASAAQELLQQAQSALPLYDLFFGKDSDVRNELFDEVASVCNHLQLVYYNATRDDNTCLEILKLVLPFATSTDLRQAIEKDISDTCTRLGLSAVSEKLEPVYTLLTSFQDSKESPPDRLARFERDAIPAIVKAAGISSFSADYGYLSVVPANCKDLFDSAAIVLRQISLDAWNNHQDQQTAVAANELAAKHAQSPELKQRLAEDNATLQQTGA
jgi:CheY-like chemotaxis protein